ncbi:MAG: tRNA pseudouridine(13) synthase TruD [Candidatus Bathyarchaeota archaeon]|nr:MAG: tRNA pseudouridine(13) synthase TruD [Candidatus Bathyarchaeota archaeon]
MRVPSIENQLGIQTFFTKTQGTGGVIRQTFEDFIVEEVLINNSSAHIELESEQPSQLPGKGRYLICLLSKRGWDTLLAVRKIAKRLGISERRVQIAGLKDKRAITNQHISIENVRLERLNRIQLDGINLYPLRYSPSMVFPHMSLGNKFKLTIRNINHTITIIRERTSNIAKKLQSLGGIPNFFGHQRFGTRRPITHLVGKALAQNNLEKAARIFLAESSPHEHPVSREARLRVMETGDYKEALSNFPRKLLYERLMMSHLVKHPKDFVGAFRRLPKRLRSLFLQAYQSYLFNLFLSQRILQEIPLNEPQLGDYVVKVDSHGLPTNSYTRTTSDKLKDLQRAVKKGEMYVAIPLIGFKQTHSQGMQGEIEQTILEKEGASQNNFYVTSMPEMSAAGELRAAIARMTDFNLEKPEEDMLNPGKRKLGISFTLYRGCYATVVLREFMKPQNLLKAGF